MVDLKWGVVLSLGVAVFGAASCTTTAREDLGVLARDMFRHNSFRYISAGTLPAAYFSAAEGALSDPYVYVVLSETKTPASRIIAFFTRDPYNHVSLSFDEDLETMVSYNGGNGRGAPGLNRETAADLCGRPGARLAVFRLHAGRGNKALMLDRVRRINDEGSSYNRLGLLSKRSVKPNIMFCSQFVYSMLELAGLDYLERESGTVKPADFIEAPAAPLTWLYGLSFHEDPRFALGGVRSE
jgi:hypothetical protein